MKTAQFAHTSATLAVVAMAVSFAGGGAMLTPNEASAGGQQTCVKNTSCQVGEFLYDDSYAPITSATCTITSKYPDGSSYLNSAGMTGQSDGWYGYSFTAPVTTGMYRTTVCCNPDGQNMCLDKSFEVVEAASGGSSLSTDDIAEAVWEYSSRSLSGFGNLVSDIWSYATRNITGGSVTVTGALTASDIEDLEESVEETRNLLEQVVNKPIIETTIEEEPDLSQKLDQTKSAVNLMYTDVQYGRSNAVALVSKWNKLSAEDIENTLDQISKRVGKSSDETLADSLFGQLKWIQDYWKWQVGDNIATTLASSSTGIEAAKSNLAKNGKSATTLKSVKELVAQLDLLEKQVGSTLDREDEGSLYSALAAVTKANEQLNREDQNLDAILADWGKTDQDTIKSNIAKSSSSIASVNKISSLKSFFSLISDVAGAKTQKELQNKIFGMKGIITANRKLLAQKPDNILASTWLELGSVVFKTVITNPSAIISQTVPVKYFLPEEVKEEHIIKLDEGLLIQYDAESSKYYVSGSFVLAPNETKTLAVSTQDIWVIEESQIESLRRETTNLTKPLERTAYFAQGVTISSDIDSSLDKIWSNQNQALTPEAKIRAYRENMIELQAAEEKVAKLRDLVASVSSSGSLLGFVGGAQAIAVWGIIVVMVAGFVFLALYMRFIKHGDLKVKANVAEPESEVATAKPISRKKAARVTAHVASYLVVGAVASLITVATVPNNQAEKNVAGVAETKQEVLGQSAINKNKSDQEPAIGGPKIVHIFVPRGHFVEVFDGVNSDASLVTKIASNVNVIELERNNDWVKIDNNATVGWVKSMYVEEASVDEVKQVLILDTPTGFLKVRSTPGGSETSQVSPGQTYLYTDENKDWYQIELEDNTLGWVSKKYSTLQ